MKICWDNLEKLRINSKGNLVDKHRSIYIEREGCRCCGEPYLTKKTQSGKYGKFCSSSCVMSFSRRGKPSWIKGKQHSEETKRKMSKPRINFIPWSKGKKLPERIKRKMRKNHADFTLDKHPRWRGGVSFEPYCQDWTKEYKNFIKERDGYKCLNPDCWRKGKQLVVHHINYNKKFCATTNLITLCNSCNSRANSSRDWHKSWYQAIIKKRYGGK